MNPAVTPEIVKNFWTCTHYDAKGKILSSHAVRSWQIVPQLDDVKIDLIGPLFAAGAVSTIRLSFVAISNANELVAEAVKPVNFDFKRVRLGDPSHVIIQAKGTSIRVLINIVKSRQTVVFFK